MTRALDVGCGTRKRAGAIGVDANPATLADVIHDLDVVPWPFEDSSFDEVFLDNVLEHLADVVQTMDEIYRVSAPSAVVRIDVPYFRSRWAAIDPTHRHAFTVESLSYFDPENESFERYRYSSARFTVDRVVFNERWPSRGVRSVVARWATSAPVTYEARLSHLYPLDELTFVLRVLKD